MVYEDVTEPILQPSALPKKAFTFAKKVVSGESPVASPPLASPVASPVASPPLASSPLASPLASPTAEQPALKEIGRETMCEMDKLIDTIDIDNIDIDGMIDNMEQKATTLDTVNEDMGTLMFDKEERIVSVSRQTHTQAITLYAFEARNEAEITVEEGESLMVLEENGEWALVRKMNCDVGETRRLHA